MSESGVAPIGGSVETMPCGSIVFAAACAAHGVYLHPHHNWFLSAAHGEKEIGRVLEATEAAFHEVAEARR